MSASLHESSPRRLEGSLFESRPLPSDGGTPKRPVDSGFDASGSFIAANALRSLGVVLIQFAINRFDAISSVGRSDESNANGVSRKQFPEPTATSVGDGRNGIVDRTICGTGGNVFCSWLKSRVIRPFLSFQRAVRFSKTPFSFLLSIMLAKEVKSGTVVVHDGNPVMIVGMSVQSPSARGAATLYKFRARNVMTRNKVDITMKGTDVLQVADFSRRDVQMMYTDTEYLHVMDKEDFQQYEIPLEDAEEQLPYITEGLEGMRALIYNDACVGIEVPATVELNIAHCDPGVKGNSATSRTKPATMETGLVVQVPEYIKEDERLKIDSRTGQFLSRA